MKRQSRVLLIMAIDAVLVNAALLMALWLRFDGAVPAHYIGVYKQVALVFTAVWLGCLYHFGLYRRLWQYASIGEMLSIVGAVCVAQLTNTAIAYFLMQASFYPLPRSVFVLTGVFGFLLLGGFRLSWRLFRDRRLKLVHANEGKPVLIVGAGDAGAAVVRELINHNTQHHMPVGFVDDNPAKHKQEMFGLRVLGSREDIPTLVERYAVEEIIIAMPSAPGRVIREIVEICHATRAHLKILPGMYELIDGKVSVSQIRDVQVEDILGRDTVNVDLESIAVYLAQRTILITGAGGSIGSELCRQVASFNPGRLVLLGHGENSIYQIHRELQSSYPDLDLVPVIVDVKDTTALAAVFQLHQPQVIFHAAAHKHVPLMEFNPAEALKNNIQGTYNMAAAADKYGAETFIFISTDKAVRPSSIMGATKRVAEMVIQDIAGHSRTRFAAVRFGNVLGSRGSVVPLFKEQIARGGPVTVTHPDMTRFFMTIPEAAQLVIQAGAFAGRGEIFVLDMGEPVKIVDLARNMIRLSGFEPEDIEIVFSGIRPGEKLYEEILTETEEVSATRHQRIFIAKPDVVDRTALGFLLAEIKQAGWMPDNENVVLLLGTVIPGFSSNERPGRMARVV